MVRFFFFFNDTATTEIYTLSLHDALPIFDAVARHAGAALDHGRALHVPRQPGHGGVRGLSRRVRESRAAAGQPADPVRSEEHTSELQSQSNLVCRLLLEKKNNVSM